MADFLGLKDDRIVRRWEGGEVAPSGPVRLIYQKIENSLLGLEKLKKINVQGKNNSLFPILSEVAISEPYNMGDDPNVAMMISCVYHNYYPHCVAIMVDSDLVAADGMLEKLHLNMKNLQFINDDIYLIFINCFDIASDVAQKIAFDKMAIACQIYIDDIDAAIFARELKDIDIDD